MGARALVGVSCFANAQPFVGSVCASSEGIDWWKALPLSSGVHAHCSRLDWVDVALHHAGVISGSTAFFAEMVAEWVGRLGYPQAADASVFPQAALHHAGVFPRFYRLSFSGLAQDGKRGLVDSTRALIEACQASSLFSRALRQPFRVSDFCKAGLVRSLSPWASCVLGG